MDTTQLNERRKQIGLSLEDVAKAANLPKSTVEKILFGVVKYPRIDTMQAIEKALGLDKTQEERELKELYAGATEEKKQLFDLIMSLSDEQVDKLTEFADFLISKREK